MLNDTAALDVWAEQTQPDDRTWRLVAEAVFAIGREPWTWPSKPLSQPTGQPIVLRELVIEAASVTVFYEHTHDSLVVDLLLVE